MSTQDMTGRTTSMTTRTSDVWRPSVSTLASRSLRAVDRIEDRAEQRAAFARHMQQFPPTIGSR